MWLLNVCLHSTLLVLWFYTYYGLRLSCLRCLFLLLNYAEGSRFESCHWIMFLTSTFILSTQIINNPTRLLYHHGCALCSCPTMVKSAVLPKTTSLCGSILVITLCCRVTQYWKQIFTSSSFNYADQNLEYFCYAVLQWQKYSCKRRILIINWSHFAKHIHLKLNFCRIWICFPQKFYFKRSCCTLFIIYYLVFWYFSWLNKTNTGVIRILQYFQYSSLKIKRNLEECLKSLNNFNLKKIFFIIPKNSKIFAFI